MGLWVPVYIARMPLGGNKGTSLTCNACLKCTLGQNGGNITCFVQDASSVSALVVTVSTITPMPYPGVNSPVKPLQNIEKSDWSADSGPLLSVEFNISYILEVGFGTNLEIVWVERCHRSSFMLSSSIQCWLHALIMHEAALNQKELCVEWVLFNFADFSLIKVCLSNPNSLIRC